MIFILLFIFVAFCAIGAFFLSALQFVFIAFVGFCVLNGLKLLR